MVEDWEEGVADFGLGGGGVGSAPLEGVAGPVPEGEIGVGVRGFELGDGDCGWGREVEGA